MLTKLLIFSTILAFVWAKLEINIEGKNGWAKNLPTWRMKNRLTDLLLAGAPLTGYHLWLTLLLALFFHLPFFLGFNWNLALELQLMGVYLIFIIIEDFLWFVLNPTFGLKNFNPQHATWHKKWYFKLPQGYYVATFLGIILILIGRTLH